MCMESMISQIRDYSFDHEKSQWTEDEFDSFLNPPQELWNLDDPQLRLSFRIYLSLSAHSSEATYDIRSSIKECYPVSTMLSFDQVRNRLKRITGILPLHFDMCVSIPALRIPAPSPPSLHVLSVENVDTINITTSTPKFLVVNSSLFH